METELVTRNAKNLKNAAKIAIVLLLLDVVLQLAGVYQTRYVLASPLIPEQTIWSINKQFVFRAMVSAIAGIVALILFFFHKYVLVIALVVLTLVGSRFVDV